jgi:hypothetical protein
MLSFVLGRTQSPASRPQISIPGDSEKERKRETEEGRKGKHDN